MARVPDFKPHRAFSVIADINKTFDTEYEINGNFIMASTAIIRVTQVTMSKIADLSAIIGSEEVKGKLIRAGLTGGYGTLLKNAKKEKRGQYSGEVEKPRSE